MIAQVKKIIYRYMADNDIDMKTLSLKIGKNKNYITHALHDHRTHHVVLAAEHVVYFHPCVVKWAEDTKAWPGNVMHRAKSKAMMCRFTRLTS